MDSSQHSSEAASDANNAPVIENERQDTNLVFGFEENGTANPENVDNEEREVNGEELNDTSESHLQNGEQVTFLTNHGFKKLLGFDMSAVVTEPITAKKGEILQNALALCRYHKWGHRVKADLFEFINSFFSSKVFPDSRYLLDELFFSQESVHYFFYCVKCTHFLGELNKKERQSLKTVTCPNDSCKEVNNITDLLEARFFVTLDIQPQIELMFQDSKFASKIYNVFDRATIDENVVSDLYSGSCYKTFVSSVLSSSEVDKILSFTLSVDGVALFVSSKCSIWPCFLMVNELPPVLRMQNLLLAGLWFGTSKAQMDLFLKPISEHLRSLSNPGFSIRVWNNEVWRVRAYMIACCTDSGARGEVQGIHSHRGEFSCNWCLHEGIEGDHARKFPFSHPLPEMRTAEGLLQDATIAMETQTIVRGVKFSPCIASLPHYDNVEGMIVEWMHAGAEGNAKKFTMEWIHGKSTNPYYIGAPGDLERIEKRIASLKPPVVVRKYVRKASDMAFYTGREWENWLLFYSVPIVSGILESRFLRHWVLFVQAAHLLLSNSITHQLLDVCERLLLEFVAKTEILYTIDMMRFNVHLLLHLVDNVRRWGCLWAISGFSFEAGNQHLKKVVFAMNGIPQQICRAISEDSALFFLKNSLKSDRANAFCENLYEARVSKFIEIGKVKLLGASGLCSLNLTEEEKWLCSQRQVDIDTSLLFKKIIKEGITYSSFCGNNIGGRCIKSNNSFARLKDKRFVRISSFIFNEVSQDIFALCNVMRCAPHLCPAEVNRVDPSAAFLFKVNSIDDDKVLLPVSYLNGICVSMQVECHFLSPVPNIYNMV